MKKIYLLLIALACSVSMSWADDGNFYEVYLTYQYNGTNANKTCSSSDNLTSPIVEMGTITSTFSITGIYEKCWDDWGSNYKCKGGQAAYKINSGSTTYITGFTRTNKTANSNNYEWQKTTETVIASSESASGNYDFELWFQTWGESSNNWGDKYINNGNNYHFTYTILPPAVTNLTVSGAISGTGTQADPYVFIKGSNMTIGATQAHTDANSALYVKFGTGDYSTTKTMTINAEGSINVQAKYRNNTASIDGTATSAQTVFYKVAAYNKTIGEGATGFYTICLPYDAEGDDNATYYTIESVTKNASNVVTGIVLSEVSSLEAGNAYIVDYPAADTYTATYSGSPVEAAVTGNAIVGNLSTEALSVPQGAYIIGADNKLHKIAGATATVRQYSAYIDLSKVAAANAEGRRVIEIAEEDQAATALDAIEAAEVVKFMENGQLFIKKNGVVYNAMGQIVK